MALAVAARARHPKVEVIYTSSAPHRIPDARRVPRAPSIRAPYGPFQVSGVIHALKHRPAMEDLPRVRQLLERDAIVHCVEETHSDENIAAGVPYPDAVDTVRAWLEPKPELGVVIAPNFGIGAVLLGSTREHAVEYRIMHRTLIETDDSEIAGAFYIQATVKPGVDPAVVEKEIDAIVSDLIEKGPTAAELQRAQSRSLAEFVRGMETLGGFGGRADLAWRRHGLDPRDLRAAFLQAPDLFGKSLDRFLVGHCAKRLEKFAGWTDRARDDHLAAGRVPEAAGRRSAEPPRWTANQLESWPEAVPPVRIHAADIEPVVALQAGIGGVPDAALRGLVDRRSLRIWTEMFSDSVLDLERAGADRNGDRHGFPVGAAFSLLFGLPHPGTSSQAGALDRALCLAPVSRGKLGATGRQGGRGPLPQAPDTGPLGGPRPN